MVIGRTPPPSLALSMSWTCRVLHDTNHHLHKFKRFEGLLPENQGQNLALTVFCVPCSIDSLSTSSPTSLMSSVACYGRRARGSHVLDMERCRLQTRRRTLWARRRTRQHTLPLTERCLLIADMTVHSHSGHPTRGCIPVWGCIPPGLEHVLGCADASCILS